MMLTAFLFLIAGVNSKQNVIDSGYFENNFLDGRPLNDILATNGSSWITTMFYHRNMMNEYLCRNYVAAEIVQALRNTTQVNRRTGEQPRKLRSGRESLLEDPGSMHYKDWLSRSSTLEDIYRHYENLAGAEDAPVGQSVPPNDGEVTGYAVVGSKVASTSYGVPDYGSSHPTYLSHDSHDSHDAPEIHEYEEVDEKGMKLKELFHLALTAIAFLAFSMFIVEVLMCVMGAEAFQNSQVMLVTPVGGASFKVDPEAETEPTSSRQKRALPLINIPIDVLNAMSSRVLSSIEAFAILNEDDGQCLRRTLCEANKYSRSLTGIQRIWIPFWSFGASWVAGRLHKKTSSRNMALMEYLKSSVMGLGNADCRSSYPKCNTGRRRKKRSAFQDP